MPNPATTLFDTVFTAATERQAMDRDCRSRIDHAKLDAVEEYFADGENCSRDWATDRVDEAESDLDAMAAEIVRHARVMAELSARPALTRIDFARPAKVAHLADYAVEGTGNHCIWSSEAYAMLAAKVEILARDAA